MEKKLTDIEITDALKELPGWEFVPARHALFKKFKFLDFGTAWAFMEKVAEEADEMSHHPEWFNVYNRVEVTLLTHDVGGVSQLDVELAQFMNGLVDTLPKQPI